MEPWQKRVITEKEELDTKICSLVSFLMAEENCGVMGEYRELLIYQRNAMLNYSDILQRRINNFN